MDAATNAALGALAVSAKATADSVKDLSDQITAQNATAAAAAAAAPPPHVPRTRALGKVDPPPVFVRDVIPLSTWVEKMLNFFALRSPDDDAAGGFARALHKVTSDLEVPTLQGFGVDEAVFRQAVPRMATAALASGSPANNPVVPSQAQVEVLFHELWDHECRASSAG